jgi:hypothetical protein
MAVVRKNSNVASKKSNINGTQKFLFRVTQCGNNRQPTFADNDDLKAYAY